MRDELSGDLTRRRASRLDAACVFGLRRRSAAVGGWVSGVI